MIRAYRMLSDQVPYPLHLGVTEAGTPFAGSIKSAVGMGSLLMDGIGDTIRVSLTADPVKEVEVAWEILKALGLRERGPVMIACPSCGRDNVGVENLAVVVEERLRDYPQAFEVAVMGCAVNGPGEAGDADFGIAGGRDVGFVYAHGRVLKKVSSDILIDELFHEIDRWIEAGMPRPKRLKLAKPAALAMAEASLIPLGPTTASSAPAATERLATVRERLTRQRTCGGVVLYRSPWLVGACSRPAAAELVDGATFRNRRRSRRPTRLRTSTIATDEGSPQWEAGRSAAGSVRRRPRRSRRLRRGRLGAEGLTWEDDVAPGLRRRGRRRRDRGRSDSSSSPSPTTSRSSRGSARPKRDQASFSVRNRRLDGVRGGPVDARRLPGRARTRHAARATTRSSRA